MSHKCEGRYEEDGDYATAGSASEPCSIYLAMVFCAHTIYHSHMLKYRPCWPSGEMDRDRDRPPERRGFAGVLLETGRSPSGTSRPR